MTFIWIAKPASQNLLILHKVSHKLFEASLHKIEHFAVKIVEGNDDIFGIPSDVDDLDERLDGTVDGRFAMSQQMQRQVRFYESWLVRR